MTKTRYIFSDFQESGGLADAFIKFDIGTFGLNYNISEGDYLQLYCLVGSDDKIKAASDAVEANEDALEQNDLSIDYLLKPYVKKNNFAYYGKVPIDTTVAYGEPFTNLTTFNVTVPIEV
jgi:hypothetical protein